MLINPRLHKGLFAVKEATMPYIQSAVHAFEPSYTKHPKQSFTGGIYQPLADESMTDTPSYFKARHRAELYTRKTTPPYKARAPKHLHTDNGSIPRNMRYEYSCDYGRAAYFLFCRRGTS